MSVLDRLRRRPPPTPSRPPFAGELLLAAFAEAHPAATFVEIGANDGKQQDYLRPHVLGCAWRGAMIEPVPYVFGRLERNYADIDRVTLIQAAVGTSDGRAPFYHLRDASPEERSALPGWYDGIGSFDREALLSHAPQIPDIAERLVCAEVEVLSLATVLARAGLERLDLLVMDTEGHDLEILRHADLAALAPRLVAFEHFHFGPDEREEARELVRRAGYELMEEAMDSFALRPADDELTACWRTLEPLAGPVYKDMEVR
jgi:FkbM family methyltransferase